MDDYSRVLNAVASGKVNNADRIIRSGLKQGYGLQGILRLLVKAYDGQYINY